MQKSILIKLIKEYDATYGAFRFHFTRKPVDLRIKYLKNFLQTKHKESDIYYYDFVKFLKKKTFHA